MARTGTTVQVDGIAELQERLKEFGVKEGRAIMRNTIRAVAAKITKQAKTNAPVDSGGLKDSIRLRPRRSTPDNPIFEVWAGSTKGAKFDAFYWRFVEYGTAASNKGGAAQPARPFIGPAAESVRAELSTLLQQEFGKKWEAAMKKTRKRAENPQG